MRRVLYILTLFSVTISYGLADSEEDENLKSSTKSTSTVSSGVYANLDLKRLDSLVADYYHYKIVDLTGEESSDFIPIDDAQRAREKGATLDSIYKMRLGMMTSIVHLPYNHVIRKQIDRYVNAPKTMGRIFGMSMMYFPLFEKELAAAGLPIELKILPIVESALEPKAMSYMGAGGLWQFTYSTGKMHGLKVNSYIDERFDPIASTKAACEFLKKLYSIYNDWTLALAAYNCGPGNVNKALAKVPNATNFWDIYFHLPMETRGYVPAFIAATYAYTFHEAHNIKFMQPKHAIITDTITISNQLLHFKQITSTLDQVSLDMLRSLNPMYKLDIIPALAQPFHLVLPQENMSQFIENQKEIYEKASVYLSDYIYDSSKDMVRDGYVIHKVKSGEVLGVIARKYRVSVSNIMKWNKIKNAKHIKPGQKLRIYL